MNSLISLFKSHIIALDEAAKEVIEVDEVRTERNNKSEFVYFCATENVSEKQF